MNSHSRDNSPKKTCENLGCLQTRKPCLPECWQSHDCSCLLFPQTELAAQKLCATAIRAQIPNPALQSSFIFLMIRNYSRLGTFPSEGEICGKVLSRSGWYFSRTPKLAKLKLKMVQLHQLTSDALIDCLSFLLYKTRANCYRKVCERVLILI